MKKVTSLKDLPSCFQLSKYGAAANFTAAQWYEQLERRSRFFKPSEGVADDLIWALFRGKVDDLLGEPLASSRDKQGSVPVSPVRPLTLIDLILQSWRDDVAFRGGRCSSDSVDRWKAVGDQYITLSNAARLSLAPLNVEFYTPDSRPIPMMQVDLAATDAALKKAFEAWLKQARAATPPPEKPIKPLYSRWVRYGLLPYLDLLIWATETGVSIPDRIYSAATALHEDMGESSFRKTVVPLAEGLMRDLSELKALAAIEESSKAHDDFGNL